MHMQMQPTYTSSNISIENGTVSITHTHIYAKSLSRRIDVVGKRYAAMAQFPAFVFSAPIQSLGRVSPSSATTHCMLIMMMESRVGHLYNQIMSTRYVIFQSFMISFSCMISASSIESVCSIKIAVC